MKKALLLISLSLVILTLAACTGNNARVENAQHSPSETLVSQPPPPPPATPTAQTQSEPAAAETQVEDSAPAQSGAVSFKLEAWADNWFAAYLDGALVVEDSVPITTERSFNAETATFEASYPLTLSFILKDFKQDDTGLEYIGTDRQQMGDGGFIMQLTDLTTGQVVAVSDAGWSCLVIHEAPLDKTCASQSNPVAGQGPCGFTALDEPDGWTSAGFDDSGWMSATVHSFNAVRPKDGYDQIAWDAAAQFIWGPDLQTDNTVLCRVHVAAPNGSN